MATTRVLWLDLDALERGDAPEPVPASFTGPWATLASWGGSALGLACLRAHVETHGAEAPALVLAVGAAVRSGLPTAARAAVLARAPLSGRYAEGHVGGELGARLARVADALVLRGRCALPGAVLALEEDGRTSLRSMPALLGLSPAETARALEAELGPVATLCIGPAGECQLPFASLASGHAPPSFVGRGGLGAVLGALGLKALCVRARPAASPTPRAEARALLERLRASPRLAARAEGGTLELFAAAEARGALGAGRGAALTREAEERAEQRHGCRGCPTPCGWIFERSDGSRQGARFGAGQALGPSLGLERLDDALALLAICDRLGMDAKEVGAVLALRHLAEERGRLPGPSARGRLAELMRRAAALGEDPGAPGRAGAARFAAELGLAGEAAVARGQALAAETSRAALLGQCVASGGADPMRSFPFLLESATLERLRALLAPLPVPRAALDARSGRAKGRLVAWHENLVSAVDLTGFCAFSAAGLLADGLADLDELACWILPPALLAPTDPAWAALAPGQRLLAAGANLVLARHAQNGLYGARLDGFGPEAEPESFVRDALEEPGMLDEYLALRGLDRRGALGAEVVERLGTPGVLDLGRAELAEFEEDARAAEVSEGRRPRAPGRVELRASGALASVLGSVRPVELLLPAPLREVLAAAARAEEAARAQLLRDGQPIPAVWRTGERLQPGDEVRTGDVLELVTAIAGG